MNLHSVPVSGDPDGVAVVDFGGLKPQQTGGTELLLTRLSAREQALCAAFSNAGRRRQWLGGRLAARRAALTFRHDAPGDSGILARSDILPDAQGRPWFFSEDRQRLPFFLSISHSARRAAALLAATPCGIDIQEINATARKVCDRFLLPEEEGLLMTAAGHGLDNILCAALLWTAKEALRKSFIVSPLPWFTTLRLAGARQDLGLFKLTFAHGISTAAYRPTVTVLAQRLDEYFLAWVVHTPEDSDA